MKKRRLFCEISPLTYNISVFKCKIIRHVKNFLNYQKLSKEKSAVKLPILVYKHNSLIRRKLGNVDLVLQENKAVNLGIAAPLVNGILIKPGETFSFWSLVGNTTKRKGYKEGLVINCGKTSSGIGGGICQFTNLIHWLVLHSPLEITEHHHHDAYDLFPDFGRQIPFGTGTSIMYNYLDYRFKNPTDTTFQLIVYTTEQYLCGELLADIKVEQKYHIKSENEFFTRENGIVYRNGEVYRDKIDVMSGKTVSHTLIRTNHAKVLYDPEKLEIIDLCNK